MKKNTRHDREELLELLWHLDESHELTLESLRLHDPERKFEAEIAELSAKGLVDFDGLKFEMTPEGRKIARGVIRRHRLAERLLTDALNKKPEEIEITACEFEHILTPELTEAICTLLGHPRICPHGSKIPQGRCCTESTRTVHSQTANIADSKSSSSAPKVHSCDKPPTHHGPPEHTATIDALSSKDMIRRHMLAERLLTDVLNKKPEETEAAACEFEHILAPDLVQSICILLGHPRECPHGTSIPKGECCVKALDTVESLVVPLTELKIGVAARIASINTENELRMNRLLAIGLTPGAAIKLLQKSPTMVVEVNKTNVAIDVAIGKEINVWKIEH